jgi:hypothetical protein
VVVTTVGIRTVVAAVDIRVVEEAGLMAVAEEDMEAAIGKDLSPHPDSRHFTGESI